MFTPSQLSEAREPMASGSGLYNVPSLHCPACFPQINTNQQLAPVQRVHRRKKTWPIKSALHQSIPTSTISGNASKKDIFESYVIKGMYPMITPSQLSEAREPMESGSGLSNAPSLHWPAYLPTLPVTINDQVAPIQKVETPRPFICRVCFKSYPYKSYLEIHMRCHSKERPFECSVCSKRFSTKQVAKTHIRRFHFGSLYQPAFPLVRPAYLGPEQTEPVDLSMSKGRTLDVLV